MAPVDFAAVHEKYRSRVCAYATRLVGRNDAEDVVQEVFLKVSRSLDSLTNWERLPAWIHAITLNAARDLSRRRACRPSAGGDPAPHLVSTPDPTMTPEERAVRNEMVACYVEFVERLPPAYHEVFVLSEFDGLSTDAIARRLGVTVATAKVRLHRARTRLHGQLQRQCHCYYNDRGELVAERRRADRASRHRRRAPTSGP
jgi:RNA polymerase sigma-70 factor (ECF subfamily)